MLAGFTYSFIWCYQNKFSYQLLDPNFSKFDFNPIHRSPLYFLGATIGLLTLSSKPKSNKPKKQTVDSNQNVSIVQSNLPYEITPKITAHSQAKKDKRKSSLRMKGVIAAILGFGIIVATVVLTRYYWTVGYPVDHVKGWLIPALYNDFWRVLYVSAFFGFLYAIVTMNREIPKKIANCTQIQLVCNLSFGMYCWHLVFVHWSFAASTTFSAF